MGKYKIIFSKAKCTGALSCVGVNQKIWKPSSDGKVDLVGSKDLKNGTFELIIDEKDYQKNKNAAKVCPVGAIKIEPVK